MDRLLAEASALNQLVDILSQWSDLRERYPEETAELYQSPLSSTESDTERTSRRSLLPAKRSFEQADSPPPSNASKRRNQFQEQLQQFSEDDQKTELRFPKTLTGSQRSEIHKLAHTFQFICRSHGKAPNRYAVVIKPNPSSPHPGPSTPPATPKKKKKTKTKKSPPKKRQKKASSSPTASDGDLVVVNGYHVVRESQFCSESTTDRILSQCVKRRSRPIGRVLPEEELSSAEKTCTWVDYHNETQRARADKAAQDTAITQRLILEMDLCLRLATHTYPSLSPFDSTNRRVKLMEEAGFCGDYRPFLSVQGLKKLMSLSTVPHLRPGDLVHVPFAPEEELYVLRHVEKELVAQHIGHVRIDSLHQLNALRPIIQNVKRTLCGRSEDDCLRWIQSHLNRRIPGEIEREEWAPYYEAQLQLHQYQPSASITSFSRLDQLSLADLVHHRELHLTGRTSVPRQQERMNMARLKSFQFHSRVSASTSEITDLKIHPLGKQIAIASLKVPNELVLYSFRTCNSRYLVGHTSTVSCISYSTDGSKLVSASYDKTVRLWNTKTGLELHKFKRERITQTDEQGQQMQVDTPGHTADIISMAHGSGSNDHLVLSADNKCGLFMWNIETNAFLADFSLHEPTNLWPGPILEMAFVGQSHPSWLVSGTDCNPATQQGIGIVQLWDIEEQKIVQTFRESDRYISCLAVNDTGTLLGVGSADQHCRLYDLRTRECSHTYETLLESELDMNCVSFSPCHRYITCAGEDNQTLVYDLRNHSLLKILPHTRLTSYLRPQGVTSAKWVSQNGLLLTGGEDGVNLWDVEASEPLLASFGNHSAPVSCLDTCEKFFCSGADDNLVNIYSGVPSSFRMF